MHGKPSSRSIAKQIGLSVATVSRVLNNRPGTSDAARSAVLDAVNRTGYRVRGGANTTVSQVGLAYTQTGAGVLRGYDADLAAGIYRELNARHANLTIIDMGQRRTGENFTQFFLRQNVQGVILRLADTHHKEIAGQISEEHFPCVVASERIDNPLVSYVDYDSRVGVGRAMDYLVQLGHVRIALAMQPPVDTDHADRLQAYLGGLARHGIESDPGLILSCTSTIPGGASAIDQLLTLPTPPTAVLFTNPPSTVGAIRHVLQRGLRLPYDLSIIGYDNADMRHSVFPSFSAVCQDAVHLGCMVANAVMERIENRDLPPARIEVPTLFEVNETTGAPPRRNLAEDEASAPVRRSPLSAIGTLAVALLAGLLPCSRAETVSPASPHVVSVQPVGANTLSVTIRHGRVVPGRQEPYVAEEGDRLEPWRHHNYLQRDGKTLGTLVGPRREILYRLPRVEDLPLSDAWAAEPRNYELANVQGGDAAYAVPQHPRSVARKARATHLVRTGVHAIETPREHVIYLSFASPLQEGATYRLQFAPHEPEIAPVTYRHAPRDTRSEAVHVSQIGFRPDDPLKLAYLSLWMGDGGAMTYPEGSSFELVRNADNRTVFAGRATLGKAADQIEFPGRVNHSGTDVWRLDFSAFSEPGEYRLYVPSVGCSYPFSIRQGVWAEAARVSMRGLYHQRSGIALGPPHSTFTRPRSFHPEDGVQVRVSSAAYVEPGKSSAPEALFDRLAHGDTGRFTTQAWGGYMDAGDFDRRIEHLVASRCLLDLVTAFPAIAEWSLDIPESGSPLPDLVDEALWGLDCYRRMQQPDGSVPAGIESAEHPRLGEASWQESLPIYQYAPDPWATGLYAATAAQAARVLSPHDPSLAEVYHASARKAMDYLDAQSNQGKLEAYGPKVVDARNLAAVHLYALSRESRWHELFQQTSAFSKPAGRTTRYEQFDQGEAIFQYLLLPDADTDETLRKHGRHAILNEATSLLKEGQETGFGWTGHPAIRIGWGRLTTPRHAISIVWAYRLTGDRSYLQGLIRACLYGAGANPLNLSFTTGVGSTWPNHVFHIDADLTQQPTPPGMTALGPQEWFLARTYWLNPYLRAHPPLKDWPANEAYFDTGMHTVSNEMTVHNSITPTFYVWAHLAMRPLLTLQP